MPRPNYPPQVWARINEAEKEIRARNKMQTLRKELLRLYDSAKRGDITREYLKAERERIEKVVQSAEFRIAWFDRAGWPWGPWEWGDALNIDIVKEI